MGTYLFLRFNRMLNPLTDGGRKDIPVKKLE